MVKKLFVLMFLTILLVGTISAIIDYGIDNSKIIKKYDAQGFAKKIEVWDDNLFGTPTTKLTTIELKTPHVVNVGVGYQKVAEFQIVGNVTYDEVLSKIDLKNMKTGKTVDRKIDIKVKKYKDVEVPTYELVCNWNETAGKDTCNYQQNGTAIVQREYWALLTPVDVQENQVLNIGLFTETKEGDYIDWIPTIAKVKITEWAEWTASLNNGLVHYYAFNESSGTTAYDNAIGGSINITDNGDWLLQQTGKVNFSAYGDAVDPGLFTSHPFNDGNFDKQVSIAYWIKYVSCDESQYKSIIKATTGGKGLSIRRENDNKIIQLYVGDGTIYRYYKFTDESWCGDSSYHLMVWLFDATSSNVSLYVDNSYKGTNTSTSFTPDYAGGDKYLLANTGGVGMYIDELGMWNRTLTTSEMSILWNSGNGNNPGNIPAGSSIQINFSS